MKWLTTPGLEILSSSTPTATAKRPNSGLPSRYLSKPKLEINELAEYAKVAAAIELNPGIVLKERIRRCLFDNAIECYDRDQVYEFLDKKMGFGKWGWAGLRKQDARHLSGWWATWKKGRVNFLEKQYNRPVPLPVLLTVQTILKSVPEAHFYISQSADENADPFLNITGQALHDFIVERWDEPNFRER